MTDVKANFYDRNNAQNAVKCRYTELSLGHTASNVELRVAEAIVRLVTRQWRHSREGGGFKAQYRACMSFAPRPAVMVGLGTPAACYCEKVKV